MEATDPIIASVPEDLKKLIILQIEQLRPKLLDLSRRNPLVSTRLSSRSASYIRVVDELPDVLFFGLTQESKFCFQPLPLLDDDPKDEESEVFQRALSEARLTDEDFVRALEGINQAADDSAVREREVERALRDRVRKQLGMSPRQTIKELSIAQHATNHGISPHYDVPLPENEHIDGRHRDTTIQTLLLPDDLEPIS